MASPLSPINNNTLNVATPSTNQLFENYEVKSYMTQSTCDGNEEMETGNDTNQSSPFVSMVKDDRGSANEEDVSAPKNRHSRVLSGNELSPLKILTSRNEALDAELLSPEKQSANFRSPRKVPRFPIRVNSTPTTPKPTVEKKDITFEDALRQNEGLTKAIQIFEDQDSILSNAEDKGDISSMIIDEEQQIEEEPVGFDDTMISTFSTFSAVPNMTALARLGHSPTKSADMYKTPTTSARGRSDLSASRTPRPATIHESGNSTSLLMDFTEQINNFSNYAQQTANRRQSSRPAETTTTNGRDSNVSVAATPMRQQHQQSNLLDFDIPPLPTPRSIPTVTPRELESLKSAFLSEISSLKASLSGKEAEVASLKTAVGDAEKRVGECMEELREARGAREALAEEREGWDRRGREMESVLRKVKDEIVHGQHDREELEQKLDESEKRREAAEMMAQEAESKMAGMRAGKATAAAAAAAAAAADVECAKCGNKSPGKPVKSPPNNSSREVEIAVERVARELHALYKSKHETKVAALRKSYESRWEKRVRELEVRIEDLADENDRLRLGRDATLSRMVDPAAAAATEELKARAAQDAAQIRELDATIVKLEAVVASVKGDNGELRRLLELERIEKGELVQLAEEMMQMQTMQSFIQKEQKQQQQQQQQQQQRHEEAPAAVSTTPAPSRVATPGRSTPKRASYHHPLSSTTTTTTTVESFRHSMVGRPSGLKAPSSMKKPTQSRIGGLAHDRNKNGGSLGGLPRPGSVTGARSGIMSSIEKMGNYRGRGE